MLPLIKLARRGMDLHSDIWKAVAEVKSFVIHVMFPAFMTRIAKERAVSVSPVEVRV